MLGRMVKELERKIETAKKNGKCALDLEMKKKVIDTQDNGLNDMLFISFPTKVDTELGRTYYNVSEYSEETARKFNSLTDLSKWIIATYC